jgi:hypothetical protein
MSWILTASGAVAGPPDITAAFAAGPPEGRQQRLERSDVVDAGTGARLRLTARPGGALQASLDWTDLEVRKVMQPSGDFHVRVAGRGDLVVFVRAGNRLRISRNGHTAASMVDQADEDGLDQVQHVLAGSRALRQFRGLFGRLGEETLGTAPGVAIDNLDALIGILLGEPTAVERRNPRAETAAARLSFVTCRADGNCFTAYVNEVVPAWDDFTQCVDDVRWFPGMQEVCAFVWLLRVESAWFHFIGCSSIPLRSN